MNNQPPSGYDPQNPYGQGESGGYGGSEPSRYSPPPGFGQGYPSGYPPQGYGQPASSPSEYGEAGYGQQPPGYPPPPYGPAPYPTGAYWLPYAVPQPDPRAGFAVAGLILGIVGLVLFCTTACDMPIIVLGLIFSFMGLQSTTRRGLAVGGLVASAIALLAVGGYFAYLLASGAYQATPFTL